MKPTEIYNECLAVEALITSRGFLRPEVSMMINFYSGRPYCLRVEMRTREDYSSSINYYPDCESEDDIPSLFEQARTWISEQKTPAEIRREQFIANLGRVIDEGRSLNLDVEFMNPLVESMRKLSENVLEYRPAAE